MDGTGAGAAVAVLRSAVDALLEVDFDAVDEVGFPEVLECLEVQRRRLEAVDVALVAAADRNNIAARHCRTSTADLLTHRLRVSPGEARARVRRARDLGPRRTLQGEELAPIHAGLAAAQAAGQICTQHVDVATRVLGKLPAQLTVTDSAVAEALLTEAARHQQPLELARTGTMLLARLDPDGDRPDEQRAYAHRELRLHRRPDGSWVLRGELTDEAGLALRTVLDPLAAPAPAPAAHGERDPRTAAQRDHDALLELCTRVLRAGTLPDTGGAPVTILIRCGADDLGDPDATAQTEHGDLIRLRTLTRLAGDAELVPILFDRTASDLKLYLGRTRRLATREQRRALAARDGGCCFPACDRPPSWTEAHHVAEWIADTGPTDIDNLAALCAFHHREFERRGWRIDMTGGLPHWIPPRWIDPDQTPVRNTAHHLPEITFTPDGSITTRHGDPPRP